MPIYQSYINHDQLTDFQLFLSLIRADVTKEPVNRDVNWRLLSNLARRHRVLPVFYANIKQLDLQEVLPSTVREYLYNQYLQIISINLRLCKKLTEILTIFENLDIPAVPFKGPVLSCKLYGDSALRYSQDLDILVSKKKVVSARDALLKSGFMLPDKDLYQGQFKKFMGYGRECDLIDMSGNAAVDLHWRLIGDLRRPYDLEFCQKRMETMSFNGSNIYCLSEEDTLLHLCLNGAGDMWHSLEQVLCVADFIKRHQHINWELLHRLADQLHCKRILYLGLFLARDMFGISLPCKIIDHFKKDNIIEKITREIYVHLFQGITKNTYIEKKAAQIPFHLKIREHPVDKFLFLLRRIFIPTQKDWKNRSIDSRFLIFYHILRPFDLIVELARAKRI
jgi:hypothetical protein